MIRCDEMSLVEFIRGELDAPATKRILEHLEGCSDCRERLQTVAAVEAFYREERASRRRSKRWLLAAGVVLAVSASLLLVLWRHSSPSKLDLASLATEEIYPYFPLETRSNDPTRRPEVQTAFEAYNRGDFREAAERLSRLPASAENSFYTGVSYYLLGRYDDALAELEEAERLGANWRTPVLWYRASVFLKMNDKGRAREVLREIVEEGSGEHQSKAIELLEKLEAVERVPP